MSRRFTVGPLALAAALAIPGAAFAATLNGSQTPLHVTPHLVGPHTPVVVTFRQPVNTTSTNSLETTERLEVMGPAHARCGGQGDVAVPAARAGARMKLTLSPARKGVPWCLGTYQGALVVSMMPRCSGPPFRACPQFVVAPRTVGHFTFRVTAS